MDLTPLLWDNPALRREWDLRSKNNSPLREALAWGGVLLLLAGYAYSAWWLSRPDRDPWSARGFLMGACTLYLLLVTVLLPGPAAGAIVRERERETWQELLLTHLQPAQLTAAKSIAVLRPAGVLLALLLPVVVMGTLAGHLPLGFGLLLLLLLGTATTAVGALSLWISSRARRTLTAMALSYTLTGFLIWGTLAAIPPLTVRGENPWWYLSPVWQAALLCLAEPQTSPLALPLLPEWTWALAAYLGLTALCLWLTNRRIAHGLAS